MIAPQPESKAKDKPKQTKPKPSGNGAKAKRAGPGGPKLMEASRGARLSAAALLEVLGGTRTPAQAAEALKISLPRYYMLETRALKAMLAACEPPPKGPKPDLGRQLEQLRHQNSKLKDECARYAALLRTAQRAIGLSKVPEKPAKSAGKRKRKKRPTVRALKVAQRLQLPPTGETADGSAGEQPSKG